MLHQKNVLKFLNINDLIKIKIRFIFQKLTFFYLILFTKFSVIFHFSVFLVFCVFTLGRKTSTLHPLKRPQQWISHSEVQQTVYATRALRDNSVDNLINNMQYCYTCKTIFDNKLIKKLSITVVVYDNMPYHKHGT